MNKGHLEHHRVEPTKGSGPWSVVVAMKNSVEHLFPQRLCGIHESVQGHPPNGPSRPLSRHISELYNKTLEMREMCV
jgi:hypothetical protein